MLPCLGKIKTFTGQGQKAQEKELSPDSELCFFISRNGSSSILEEITLI